jgi:hypothetical protein
MVVDQVRAHVQALRVATVQQMIRLPLHVPDREAYLRGRREAALQSRLDTLDEVLAILETDGR